ncbi:MAG: hypothetical protein WEC59_13445 [Salibacteraceae bacterium]
MRIWIKTLFFCLLTLSSTSCYKCYECTVTVTQGELTQEVCGRNKEIAALIQELETDTVGNGPWRCE